MIEYVECEIEELLVSDTESWDAIIQVEVEWN